MAEQFITLMADLDNESQKRMAGWYDELRQVLLLRVELGIPITKKSLDKVESLPKIH